MDSFVIRVLAPTCCNSYFEYVKFANDDREKNTIRRTTSLALGVIFTTEVNVYVIWVVITYNTCTFLQKCISRNTIKSYAFHTSAIENLVLCHGCIFVLELHEVQYLKWIVRSEWMTKIKWKQPLEMKVFDHSVWKS